MKQSFRVGKRIDKRSGEGWQIETKGPLELSDLKFKARAVSMVESLAMLSQLGAGLE